MKDEILRSALDLAERKGWEQVSTRRITKEFGYTTSAIYHYLGGKDELLTELQRQGFVQLKAAMQQAAEQWPGDATQQFRAVSLSFWDFAFANRSLYQLMFGLAAVACKGATGPEIREAGGVVQTILSKLSAIKPFDLFLNWWALATGFVAIGLNAAVNQQNAIRIAFSDSIDRFVQQL